MNELKNPTAFQIYKKISQELGLLFPLQERDIVVRKNPIPNNLEFHLKGISKKELNDNMDQVASTYYKLYKNLNDDFYKLHNKCKIFNEKPREYPDRKVNISTVISILFISGFREEELYNRALNYLLKYKENEK